MADRYDIIIVGARCAGSTLACLLARGGARVAVVEQAEFPSDTLSTHVVQSDGLAFLGRLGLTEQLRATGAPFIGRVDARVEDVRRVSDWPQRPGDIGGLASIRRIVLDQILARAADDAGAEMHMGTRVTSLLERDGRVTGVSVTAGGRTAELTAPLVVGADGRNSTVGRLCGARRYNLARNQRAWYWGFFEGAAIGSEPTFVFHRWADRSVGGCPADGGLYQVAVSPELAQLDRFRSELPNSFLEHARSCRPVADALAPARRGGKLLGIVRCTTFFREASGPGWVLVGDAGHFKDPTAGRGIGDAFLQVDALAPVILTAPLDRRDAAIAEWGRWRDAEFSEHSSLAAELGKAGPVNASLPELFRALHDAGNDRLFLDLLNHRAKPSSVFTPRRMIASTGRLLVRPRSDRRRVLGDTATLLADDMRRRRLHRRPVYEPSLR